LARKQRRREDDREIARRHFVARRVLRHLVEQREQRAQRDTATRRQYRERATQHIDALDAALLGEHELSGGNESVEELKCGDWLGQLAEPALEHAGDDVNVDALGGGEQQRLAGEKALRDELDELHGAREAENALFIATAL
jgi:hypothetical protein